MTMYSHTKDCSFLIVALLTCLICLTFFGCFFFFQGIFVTRVQPEGPASKILQPGDKIIQVFFVSCLYNISISTIEFCRDFNQAFVILFPGKRIQLCEYWPWERCFPAEDISKHCGYDYHERYSSIDSTDTALWRKEGEERGRQTVVFTCIFLCTEEADVLTPAWTIYTSQLWLKLGKTTEYSGYKWERSKHQVWFLKRPSLWYLYIFIQKKLKMLWCK